MRTATWNAVLRAGAFAFVFGGSVALLWPALAEVSSTEPSTASTEAASSSDTLLSEDDLEILVARIALYPDDLVAAIIAGSLYPLQIVEAERFLTEHASKPDAKPDDKWDGSVISLLNYPDIVKMMSDDLTWTQQLGDAAADQEQDLLMAIQQLRDEAMNKGVLQSTDKVVVEKKDDNVVIRSSDPEVVYVPTYPPEMFYEPGYVWPAALYYGPPFPSYFYPGATFWSGFITGAIWGAAIDWRHWGAYGGNINVDINTINNRFNIDFDKVDLKNFDRSKLKNIDRSKLDLKNANFDRDKLANNLSKDAHNKIANKARDRPGEHKTLSGGAVHGKDVRKSVQQGLSDGARPGKSNRTASLDTNRPGAHGGGISKDTGLSKKAGARPDNRPRQPSALGEPKKGKVATAQSNRGAASRGGGYHGGTPHRGSVGAAHMGGGGGQQIRRSGGGGGMRRR